MCQATVSAYMLSSIFLELRLWASCTERACCSNAGVVVLI